MPPWLAPVQVVGIPIASRHADYLRSVLDRSRAGGMRVEVDDSDERMQKKIVRAQQAKAPFMLIAGDRDIDAGAVSFPVPVRPRAAQGAGQRRGRRDRGGSFRGRHADPEALRPADG